VGDRVGLRGIQAGSLASSSVVGLVDLSVGEAGASASDGVLEGGGVSSREYAHIFFFFRLPDFLPDAGVASGEVGKKGDRCLDRRCDKKKERVWKVSGHLPC
jgi:hypothetical protein